MATSRRRNGDSVGDQLLREPYRFSFFQAVRLLERMRTQSAPGVRPLGYDHHPSEEVARLGGVATRAFAAADVDEIEWDESNPDEQPKLSVHCMGLYGYQGALPMHDTQIVIEQSRARRHALRDFLDVFNHRLLSLYYRAWEKYRFPVVYDRYQATEGQIDPCSVTLLSLIGLGVDEVRDRLELNDETLVFYGGNLARHPRSAIALSRMLAHYAGVETDIQQFQGQWIFLDPKNQSRLPAAGQHGAPLELGNNVIVGDRFWTVESKFRVRFGPLEYKQFCQLLPGSDRLTRIAQLIRTYVGPAMEFDVQVVLRADEIPAIQMDSSQPGAGPRLGQTTWLISTEPENDAEDAIFCHDGNPQ